MSTARIYQRPKNAMQSGRFRTDRWVLEYEPGEQQKRECLPARCARSSQQAAPVKSHRQDCPSLLVAPPGSGGPTAVPRQLTCDLDAVAVFTPHRAMSGCF